MSEIHGFIWWPVSASREQSCGVTLFTPQLLEGVVVSTLLRHNSFQKLWREHYLRFLKKLWRGFLVTPQLFPVR